MFGPNKNISEWCIPQKRDNPLKRGIKHPSNWGIAILKTGGHKRHYYKRKKKRLFVENSGESSDQPENDLSVVKPELQFRAAASGGQQKT